MGGGGGSSNYYYWFHATSGQSGGRVMPGISVRGRTDGYGHPQVGWITQNAGYLPPALDPAIVVDEFRPWPGYLVFYTKTGSPGGGPGEQGANGGSFHEVSAASVGVVDPNAYAYHHLRITQASGPDSIFTGISGGGGGWGAAGGSVISSTVDANNVVNGSTVAAAGGAGGKAIQTNGNSVTWLGGQARAYGAVG